MKSKSKETMFDNIVSRYHPKFQEEENRIANKQKEITIDPHTFNKLKEKISGVRQEQDKHLPIISKYEMYQTIKDISDVEKNKGITSLAFYLKSKWEESPLDYFTLGDIDSLRKVSEKLMPRRLFSKTSAVVSDIFDGVLKSSIKNRFDIKKLDHIAGRIDSQEEYITSINLNGFALHRPDMEEIRNYIAHKVNTRAGKNVVSSDAFTPDNAVKRNTINSNTNSGTFDVEKYKGITSSDWSTTQAAIKVSKTIKNAFVSEEALNGKIKLAEALNRSNTAYHTDLKKGRVYIAYKDSLDNFYLYSKTGSNDAVLLDKYSSFEELQDNVCPLDDMWEI